jgi:hypothetical protein
MIKFFLKSWPVLLLIIFAFLLRVVKLEELFYFTYDESVFAFVGRRLLLWNHLPLIGGVTPFGVHVAPYFYWFFAGTLILGKLDPLFWGYVSAALGAAATILIYVVATKIDSKKVGFLAASFWTFSYLANLYDRHFWGLTFGPIFSILVIYLLYKIIKGNEKFVYALGFTLGLVIHADLSFYMFFIMSVVSWIVFKIQVKKSTFIALGIIAASFLPLVVFDLRHDFANTRPILEFLQSGKNTPEFSWTKAQENALLFPRTFARFVYPQGDNEISKQYSYCQVFAKEKLGTVSLPVAAISSLIILAFAYWSFKKSKNVGWKLVSLLVLLYFVGIQFYGTILRADIFEHYLSGIFVLFSLIFAKVLSSFPRKIMLSALVLFVAWNLCKLSLAKNDLGLKVKRNAINYTMQVVGDRPFSLDSLSTCWKLNGYRYLFSVYGQEPVKSYVDPNFAYLYGTTRVWDKHPQTVVAFVTHDFVPETPEFYERYALLKSHQLESKIFGIVEVIVMDNTSGWFDEPQK